MLGNKFYDSIFGGVPADLFTQLWGYGWIFFGIFIKSVKKKIPPTWRIIPVSK